MPRASLWAPDTGSPLISQVILRGGPRHSKRERQQQHQQQREESELTGRPAICAWTAPTNRVIKGETIEDSLLRRAKKQQSRLEWMQRQAASEEKERTNTRKYMAVKTAVMTEGRQRALPVEDLLIAQGELSKQRKNYLRQVPGAIIYLHAILY